MILTFMQLWVLLVGGPLVMILTVMIGILINAKLTARNLSKLETVVERFEETLRSQVRRF